ncbi:MAG: glycosyltransferase family protein [Proteobacteria bacterium]|nr:glycosyltransferase family protein [Pseudomonadota bacterium]
MATASTDARLAQAAAHEQAGRFAEAAALYDAILAAEPDHADALHLRGVIAYRNGELARAIALIERATAVNDTVALFHRNLCELCRLAGRTDDAIRHGRRAVALAPDDAHAYYNLGLAHYDRLEIDQASACQRAALAREPGFAGAHFELAETLLLRGDLAAGWDEYEWRWQLPSAPPELRALRQPLWSGEPLADRRLLLIADQGFGDTIQFARYIPLAAARCANLIVACSPQMTPVIAQLAGAAAIHEVWDRIPPYDLQCPLSSLPRAFGTTLDTIPAPIPYLHADPAKSAHWRQRLDALLPRGYRRIGLVWAGRPAHENDRNRSLALDRLAPLAGLPGIALVALQLGPAQAQIGGFYGAAPLVNLAPEIADFTDTLAILDNLDLVVAVDTAVAHLAGAMAKPVFVLLPYAPDWRWLLDRTDSPWYPTARLFRQPALRDWDAVINNLISVLAMA